MRLALGPRGLRARIVLGFAVGSLLVSGVLVGVTFVLARSYLLDQREESLTRQAFAVANVLNSRLSTAGTEVGDVLGELVPSGRADVVVRDAGSWYSSSLDVGARDVPPELQEIVGSGMAGSVATEAVTGPRLVVGVPVVEAGVEFYLLADLAELQQVLRTLASVLGAGVLAATAAGATFGAWASRRAVQPLEQVAGVATRIAGGELTTRLPATDDPDLVGIVAGFNSMVDALSTRIERDARFVGDVSHELRSPLTTLVTSVEVLAARREDLSQRAQQALGLVEAELGRFRRTLEDLLQLARLEGGDALEGATPVSLSALVRELLAAGGYRGVELRVAGDEQTVVRGDKASLQRAVRNLLDNADRHAGGACAVSVENRHGSVVVTVDDAGSGVAVEDRERIFERFARGPRAARGSLPGAGLGLAIVAETAERHGRGLVHRFPLRRRPVHPVTAGARPVTGERLLAAAVLTAGLTVVTACGVPTGGAPTTIPASDIPYGLAAPSPTPTAEPSADPELDRSRIFLVGEGDVLVARPRDIDGSSRRERLEHLLTALAAGPTGTERDEEFSTASAPGMRLTVAELSGGTVTVDIDGPAEAPSGWASRRAVAQIVLTATSVPGVDAVRLTLSGEPVEAPLPSGELTSEPLTADDYAPVLTPTSSPPS